MLRAFLILSVVLAAVGCPKEEDQAADVGSVAAPAPSPSAAAPAKSAAEITADNADATVADLEKEIAAAGED